MDFRGRAEFLFERRAALKDVHKKARGDLVGKGVSTASRRLRRRGFSCHARTGYALASAGSTGDRLGARPVPDAGRARLAELTGNLSESKVSDPEAVVAEYYAEATMLVSL